MNDQRALDHAIATVPRRGPRDHTYAPEPLASLRRAVLTEHDERHDGQARFCAESAACRIAAVVAA